MRIGRDFFLQIGKLSAHALLWHKFAANMHYVAYLEKSLPTFTHSFALFLFPVKSCNFYLEGISAKSCHMTFEVIDIRILPFVVA